jgi:hypothetical protein
LTDAAPAASRTLERMVEFMRIRPSENAHATLDRLTNRASDLDEVTTRAKSLFSTLDLPQKPDALRI